MPQLFPFSLFDVPSSVTPPSPSLSSISKEEESEFRLKVQYQAFSKQLPLMYCILLLNTWILSSNHREIAPIWLTLYIPIVLSVICLVRLTYWQKMRKQELTPAMIKQRMRQTTLLTAPITLAFCAWALMLFQYGDTSSRSHTVGYIGLSMLCCMLCLMHIRLAALIVIAIANASFIILFVSSGQDHSSAVNVGVSLAGIMLMLYFYYRDFMQLIKAQMQAEALSRDNDMLANHDSLTELPNRRKFFHDLDWYCTLPADSQTPFALCILDLDGFKPVNDLYGHGTGDKLLFAVSRRLENLCTDQASVYRLGGDEFAIIITASMDEPALLEYCSQINHVLCSPYSINNHTIHISVTIGLVIFPYMAQTANELYEFADYALYHGKRNYRADVTLFSSEHSDLILRDANIEQALRRADLEQELNIFFQPITSGHGQRTVAFEALARWNSSQLGSVSPELFIPIAEQVGLINDITLVLLVKALQVASTWPQDIRLAFNLSAHDIGSQRVVERIIHLVENSGIAAHRLDFEITETAALHDLAQVKWSTEQLRQIGCGITLDDFGTGYSSFRQLHELPLTKIKIDRCFVQDIHVNALSRKIVQSLLTLSREMEIQCVLEGVETEEELNYLIYMGAKLFQGYYFSKPVPESMTLSLLSAPAGTARAQ